MQILITEGPPRRVDIDGQELTDLRMYSYNSGPPSAYAPFEHFEVVTYTGLLGATRVRVQIEQHHQQVDTREHKCYRCGDLTLLGTAWCQKCLDNAAEQRRKPTPRTPLPPSKKFPLTPRMRRTRS